MKYKKKLIGLECILIVVVCMCMPQTSSTAKNTHSYKKLYDQYLAKIETRKNAANYPDYYYVLNMDKKGVPELITCSSGEGSGGRAAYEVFTIKNKKVISLGTAITRDYSLNPELKWSPKYKALMTTGFGHYGLLSSDLYCIKKAKLKLKYSMRTYEDYRSNNTVYEIGIKNKKVDKKKYNAYNKKYFNKIKKYKMKENTQANRQKSFK